MIGLRVPETVWLDRHGVPSRGSPGLDREFGGVSRRYSERSARRADASVNSCAAGWRGAPARTENGRATKHRKQEPLDRTARHLAARRFGELSGPEPQGRDGEAAGSI